jgi:hypothetical protein
MALTFAVSTYYDELNPACKDCVLPVFISLAEIIFMMVILADYLLFFLIADNRIWYIFSFQSFITLLTVVPTFMVRFGVVADKAIIATYYLNAWKVFRLFSIFRMIKVFTRRNLPTARVHFKLVYILLLMIFVFTAAMLTLENQAIYADTKAEEI